MRRIESQFTTMMFALCAFALAEAEVTTAESEQIDVDGVSLFLRVPEHPAPGRPWLWVAEFFGVDRTLEDALLAAGWHVAYVRVADQFGSPWSMDQWDKAYDELHGRRGLAAKPALLGLSRGGLYALAWLRRHPDRASVLILDNAVADVRSWPAGIKLRVQGDGDSFEWERYKQRWRFADDAQAMAESPRPTDNLRPAVKEGVLLVAGYGTADTLVPYGDNGGVLEEFWRGNGGRVEVFPREGAEHHPHGFLDLDDLVALLRREAESKKEGDPRGSPP
jgi:pimeloyl-ACP methyl ester carboxylesterase